MARPAGEAFFVGPESGQRGPGVLVLHSWWGLNDWVRDLCRRLSDEGYTVLAPDLLHGETPATPDEGERALADLDADELSGLILASTGVLQRAAAGDDEPIAVVGLSMGASLALWLAARSSDTVRAVVSFYGAQSIDFDRAQAVFQGHYAEHDHLVSEEDRITTEAFIRLGDNDTEFHLYPGTSHWFFEEGETFDHDAADLAWDRMVGFLHRHHPVDRTTDDGTDGGD